MDPQARNELDRQRRSVLALLDDWLEWPMVLLALAWLALFIVEVTAGLTPFLEAAGTAIWIAFVLEFALRFSIAPEKLAFLRRSWLTAISLALPALRLFRVVRAIRVLRAVRVVRGLRLVRVVGSIQRGARALGTTMARRGLGYVLAVTALVLLMGAAGMYAFERDVDHPAGLHDYGSSLWWTAMILTTMGSEYWPKTPEGRLLCLFLSIYGFVIFGYVAATLASHFIERDREERERR